MSVESMAKDIKKVHPKFIMMYKVGNFVECFGKDATIIAYIFNYKLKEMKSKNLTCGFPINAIPKVTSALERRKLSYVIVSTKDNYHEDSVVDFKNLNTYDKIIDNSKVYAKIYRRTFRIINEIKSNRYDKEMLEKLKIIEEVLGINQ